MKLCRNGAALFAVLALGPRVVASDAAQTPGSAAADVAKETEAAAALEAVLRKEPTDVAWAGRIDADIRRALAARPAVLLDGTECRSTMCRVELAFPDEEIQERTLEDLPRTPPFDTHGFIRRAATDGAHRVVVYIARKGTRLPGR